jgi:apolipoprotein N-acyltransferase
MRAIEQGVPMVRVANTGVSAVIDAYGRTLASIGLGETGYLDTYLPPSRITTLYSRAGDMPVVIVLLIAVAGLFWNQRRIKD